jgi:hypothetical protein
VLELHDGILDWDCVTVTGRSRARCSASTRSDRQPDRERASCRCGNFSIHGRGAYYSALPARPRFEKLENADLSTAALHSAVGGRIQDIGKACRRLARSVRASRMFRRIVCVDVLAVPAALSRSPRVACPRCSPDA